MKAGWIAKLGLTLMGSVMLGGCVLADFSMPWEKKVEASDIPTREPLEIPPDLYKLPDANYKPQKPGSAAEVDASTQAGEAASQILFGEGQVGETPSPDDRVQSGRKSQETLPDWLNQ
ncbi:hypothetical protein Mmc1_2145 [Magnetococcus marinus MC-1]|uniref:Lipoprotein n=1 Tax=Magnetococcus marinus (strain ATCC BAA-1437 / JCM 17883 / MC-1) TaxID=156889 RepID=A0L9K3_MAGMM|nr:hypothetical protein [Magnetococcus marinus]ABK44646.1 hypothetical protein Mmc1_2145 [Magnetococcus marinus MC-1]